VITNRKGRYSVVSVAIEDGCGFLTLEVASKMLVSKASFELAYLEQLLMKKYQPSSKCNAAQKSTCPFWCKE